MPQRRVLSRLILVAAVLLAPTRLDAGITEVNGVTGRGALDVPPGFGFGEAFGAVCAATQARADRQQTVIIVEGPTAGGEATTLARALDLLPRRPPRVAVIDAMRARPDARDTLLHLDAFVVRDSPVIYVVRQGALLQGAIGRSSIHLHALAAAIWHEVAHVDGADEREARTREQILWVSFIRDQRVDSVNGLRYLSALERRPDHQLEARAEVAR